MVLFLFVVMMLDINVEELRKGFTRYLPLGVARRADRRARDRPRDLVRPAGLAFARRPTPHAADYSNTKELGAVLYTQHVYAFEIASVILLLAIVAAITLTMRKRPGLKVQNVAKQVACAARGSRADRQGRSRARSADDSPSRQRTTSCSRPILFSLSVAGIFLEPQERDPAADVHRAACCSRSTSTSSRSRAMLERHGSGRCSCSSSSTVAAAEAAIGLAILVVLFRNTRTHRRRRARQAEGLDACSAEPLPRRSCSRRSPRPSSPACSARRSAARARTGVTIARRRDFVRAVGRRAAATSCSRRAASLQRHRVRVAERRRSASASRSASSIDHLTALMMVVVTFVSLMRARLHDRLHGTTTPATSASSATSRCSRSRC